MNVRLKRTGGVRMFEWFITSSVLILVVILIRFLFRKRLALRVRYALWLAAVLRLLVPVTLLESPVSVLNLLPGELQAFIDGRAAAEDDGTSEGQPLPAGDSLADEADRLTWESREKASGGEQPVQDGKQPESDPAAEGPKGTGSDLYPETESGVLSPAEQAEQGENGYGGTERKRPVDLAGLRNGIYVLWAAGAFLCAALVVTVNLDYRRRLRRSRRAFEGELTEFLPRSLGEKMASGRGGRHTGLELYVSGAVRTPCLFGLARPGVYLTPEAAAEMESLHYVICHECIHYRHRDNIWALVRAACLCLHWYNPLVWLAAALSRQDGELACDEETIRWLGERERLDYGIALLDFCAKGSIPLQSVSLATTMSGGKRKLRERLELIARAPKKTKGALGAAVALLALVLAVTFTGKQAAGAAGLADGKVSGGDGLPLNDSSADESRPAPQDTALGGGEAADQETSWGYNDYTGYLDECPGWTAKYRSDFADQDYDNDGLRDRVWRENVEDWALADYRIEFGNGEVLSIDSMGGGLPEVQTGDLTGDGVPEILFSLSYHYSTDETAFGSMALYEKTEEGWQRMELPAGFVKDPEGTDDFGERKRYQPTITCHYERTGAYSLRVTCLETAEEAPLNAEAEFDRDLWENWIYSDYDGRDLECPVWKAQLCGQENGSPQLLLYAAPVYRSGDEIILTLRYRDGGLHIEDAAYWRSQAETLNLDLGDGEVYYLQVRSDTEVGSGLFRLAGAELYRAVNGAGIFVTALDLNVPGRSAGVSPNLYRASSPAGGLQLLDLNFDGAEDICLAEDYGVPDIPYSCYVWDKERQAFCYAGKIYNVDVDLETKRIMGTTTLGNGVYVTCYYHLTGSSGASEADTGTTGAGERQESESGGLRLVLEGYDLEDLSPEAELDRLSLTYTETDYSLPAVDDWDYEGHEGVLHDRIVFWSYQALLELYRWTGVKTERACVTVTEDGTFYFGDTAEELKREDYFYSRAYSVLEAGWTARYGAPAVSRMILDPERDPRAGVRIPEPDNLAEMSDKEIVGWYFERWSQAAGSLSGLPAAGERAESIEETMLDNPRLRDFVIRTDSGRYYELSYYSDDLTRVHYIFGPYEEYPAH